MSPLRENVILAVLVAIVVVAVLVGVFVAFGPLGLYAKSESPEFCGSCHVLQPEYEAWFHSGAHQTIKCIDCHLPNDKLAHHLWAKSLEGVSDSLAFHTGRFHEPITLSNSGAKVVVENCRRCHSEIMARVNEERRCWECHRRMTHRRTGAIATLTP